MRNTSTPPIREACRHTDGRAAMPQSDLKTRTACHYTGGQAATPQADPKTLTACRHTDRQTATPQAEPMTFGSHNPAAPSATKGAR